MMNQERCCGRLTRRSDTPYHPRPPPYLRSVVAVAAAPLLFTQTADNRWTENQAIARLPEAAPTACGRKAAKAHFGSAREEGGVPCMARRQHPSSNSAFPRCGQNDAAALMAACLQLRGAKRLVQQGCRHEGSIWLEGGGLWRQHEVPSMSADGPRKDRRAAGLHDSGRRGQSIVPREAAGRRGSFRIALSPVHVRSCFRALFAASAGSIRHALRAMTAAASAIATAAPPQTMIHFPTSAAARGFQRETRAGRPLGVAASREQTLCSETACVRRRALPRTVGRLCAATRSTESTLRCGSPHSHHPEVWVHIFYQGAHTRANAMRTICAECTAGNELVHGTTCVIMLRTRRLPLMPAFDEREEADVPHK
eukprot:354728-Chlamydomonas_euryale.AAC.6